MSNYIIVSIISGILFVIMDGLINANPIRDFSYMTGNYLSVLSNNINIE